MDLIQCNSTDDQGCTLGTTVSAGIHQHRDEGNQKWDCSKSVLIFRDDRSGDNGSKHQDQKPGDTVHGMLEDRSIKISFFTWIDSSHFCDILGCLIDHDIHCIIESNDSDHQSIGIQDRKCQQIVFGEKLGYIFLVIMGRYRNNLRLHQVFDRNIILSRHQIFGTDDADQLSAFCDVAGIDRLFMDSGTLDMSHGLSHGHCITQINIFGCHNASGTVIRIVQKLVDHLTVCRTDGVEDTVDQVSRKFFKHIDRIIHIQVI